MRISCSSQVNFGTCFGSAWVEKIFLFYIKTISWWHYFCFFNIGKKNVLKFVFILVFWQCFSNKMTYVCFCVGLIRLRKKMPLHPSTSLLHCQKRELNTKMILYSKYLEIVCQNLKIFSKNTSNQYTFYYCSSIDLIFNYFVSLYW